MTNPECLFCDQDNPERHTIIMENELSYARWDNFPVSDGHAEVVPKRHVESYFELTDDEVLAVYGLAKSAREIILNRYGADGFTLGVNEGEAAGRTIHHLHFHLIPRYIGDVADPRGGLRGVIPGKKSY